MNKRYMDFVPSQSAKRTVASRTGQKSAAPVVSGAKRATATKRVTSERQPVKKVGGITKPAAKAVSPVARLATRTVSSTAKPAAKSVAKPAAKPVARAEAKPAPSKMVFSDEKDVALGVIENVGAKFVKTDVPKRPLSSTSHFAKTGVAAAKAKKLTNVRTAAVPAAAKRGKSIETKTAPKKEVGTYTPPKTPFINQEKVQKRPLSKNVYRKKVDTPVREEKKDPVTIIAKPEKDNHVGLVVTIILTIILGAAAGTVAFLLLPK